MEKKVSLADVAIFTDLTPAELAAIEQFIEFTTFEQGVDIIQEGSEGDDLYVILSGQAQVRRGTLDLSTLEAGGCFGELGLLSTQVRAASVTATTRLEVGRLSRQALDTLMDEQTALAKKLYRNVGKVLRDMVTDITDTVALLLGNNARQLRTEVEVRTNGVVNIAKAGTKLRALLPATVDGEAVIAATLDRKAVSLNRSIYASGRLEPLTRTSMEGSVIYRQSVGLMLVEAGHMLSPPAKLGIGPSLGFAYIIEVIDAGGRDLKTLASQLAAMMKQLVAEDRPIRRERRTVEEARSQFLDQGWDMAARVLHSSRNSSVTLVSMGEIYAFEFGPKAPSTALLEHFDLDTRSDTLLLYFRDEELRATDPVQSQVPNHLARQHDSWLNALGITSVGNYNDACVSGEVSQIIRVAEGFHEKRISQIADEIVSRSPLPRIICISGPSSSGKTTFIKRLSVQLRVNGLVPRTLSLDNYYVDREKTVRDEDGEFDFEAYQALDQDLMARDFNALVAGREIRTARYDFASGLSNPEGGPLTSLGPNEILMLEGIHALNPELPVEQGHRVFRIFINPMTSLPLDPVNRVSVSDIRLVRRIVRDRHQRCITAADNILRWPSVSRGERRHIFPFQRLADSVFNSSLIYELSVLKVYAERYLLEVPQDNPAFTTAFRLRRMIAHFVAIYPNHVPPTSLLREFIGGSGFPEH
ncbi:MAG: hypothetical protein AUK47_06600 [Deltaproteobacteria bacterium CG2_30_63_29]|nr:MAG: hypothetical protein AUK47_06600 [Deltaproteobacteria bacterium CG2_30_63_29]